MKNMFLQTKEAYNYAFFFCTYWVSKKQLTSFGMKISPEFHWGNLNTSMGTQRKESEPSFSA